MTHGRAARLSVRRNIVVAIPAVKLTRRIRGPGEYTRI
jgi:hypothetical protein